MTPLIHDWFSSVAAAVPDAVAIERGGLEVSYADLEASSNRIANFLLAGGPARTVAILSSNPVSVMTAILGVLKAGGIFVPLDLRQPSARLNEILAETAADVILCDDGETARAQLPENRARCATLETALGAGAVRPALDVDPDAPCYVYFSSGSTGRPKGIVGRLKAIAHFISWEKDALDIQPGIRVSQLTTPSFDAFLRDMFLPLCSAGTVCVPERREDILDPRALIGWLEDRRIGLLHCVPSLFFTLLRDDLEPSRLPDLRHVLMAGEVLPPGAVDRWMSVFGERIRLVNLYGPSETTMIKFAHFVAEADRTRRSVPIGKPIADTEAFLLDAQGRFCPAGAVGEIHIRTPYRTHGYLNQPALTAQAFVRDPAGDAPDALVYRTGDLARQLPDGSYEFLGRRDSQVKIRGVRVELSEIEEVLCRHPAVIEAAAAVHGAEAGGARLYAYVQLSSEASGLREHVAGHLPEEMVPSAVFVLDRLPRTVSGKLDRRALPAPSEATQLAETAYVAPRTETERRLAAIWADVLRCARIGRDDDFFRSGGDSLLAMSAISRAATAFEVEIPLRRLFEGPTLAAFARQVELLRESDIEMESGAL
ncbi:MAG TPA: non-ribosomal peptide synthetase [Rhizomicrobium sp.]|nr:non-ribosomal peptide synthetase [Rhizomicrobium sp.]